MLRGLKSNHIADLFFSYAKNYYCKHLFIRDVPQEHLKWNDLQTEDSDYGRICRAILNGDGSQMP